MNTYRYKAFGLRIDSALECPELLPGSETPEVVIRYGEVPMALDDAKAKGVLYQAKPKKFLLRLDGIARYMVSDGKEILIEPAPNSNENEIRLFLFSSVFGALLHQRGVLPLHASAIETKKGAVMFVGPSGAGKSTVAAAFQARGLRVLSDDIGVILSNGDGVPMVLPGYPQMKLWADVTEKLGTDRERLNRVRADREKYAVPLQEGFMQDAVPLYAVYTISTTNTQVLDLKELTGIPAFHVFVRNTYRRRFLDGLGGREGHFEQAAATAKHAKIRRVTRPYRPFLLDELIQLLEEDFA